eukprot:1411780-Rhodomonas_salina.2
MARMARGRMRMELSLSLRMRNSASFPTACTDTRHVRTRQRGAGAEPARGEDRRDGSECVFRRGEEVDGEAALRSHAPGQVRAAHGACRRRGCETSASEGGRSLMRLPSMTSRLSCGARPVSEPRVAGSHKPQAHTHAQRASADPGLHTRFGKRCETKAFFSSFFFLFSRWHFAHLRHGVEGVGQALQGVVGQIQVPEAQLGEVVGESLGFHQHTQGQACLDSSLCCASNEKAMRGERTCAENVKRGGRWLTDTSIELWEA